jgi:hypothetical protein
MAMAWRGSSLFSHKASKRFFFVKKKQKTFICFRPSRLTGVARAHR